METIENESTGIEGTNVPVIESPAESAESTPDVVSGREDSISGVGVEENAPEEVIYRVVPEAALNNFPVKLVNPGGDIFQPYAAAAEAFLKEVLALPDPHINWLTIGRMTVPSIDAPEVHITPHCGFPVTKGNIFSVLLSDGQLITA